MLSGDPTKASNPGEGRPNFKIHESRLPDSKKQTAYLTDRFAVEHSKTY